MTIFNPDPIYAEGTDESSQIEWLERNFNKLKNWTQSVPTIVEPYDAVITDDAGDGTPHGDLNATDFTGHPFAEGTALLILTNAVITFSHKSVAYKWSGPTGVYVGVGGDYTALSTDLTPLGTNDHTKLGNRTAIDSHPTSAITDLDTKQASQDADILANTNNLNTHVGDFTNPHQVTHSQLTDTSAADSHPTSAITNLDTDQAAQDSAISANATAISDHINDTGDPHPQYVQQGYGGIYRETPTTGFGALTTSWTVISGSAYTTNLTPTPIAVTQDLTNGRITITETGIWMLSIALTADIVPVTSNDSNTVELTLWDVTSAAAGDQPITFTVPRYGETIDFGITVPFRATSAEINTEFALAIRTRKASPSIDITDLIALDFHAVRVGND